MQQHNHIDEARVRAKAYELWQARGCPEGSGDQDWIEAERLLSAELGAATPTVGVSAGEDPDEAPVAVRVPRVVTSAPAPATERREKAAASRRIEVEPPSELRPDELTVPSAGVVVSRSRSHDARVDPAEVSPVTQRGEGEVASKRRGASVPERRVSAPGPTSGGKNGKPTSSSARKTDSKPDPKRKSGRGR